MAMAALLGFVLGLLGAIPVAGPVAVLVIARGLHGHIRSAILIATGSAVAEGGYAALAFWGLGALVSRNAWLDVASRGLAAGILAALAVVLIRGSEPRPWREQPREGRPRGTGGFALGFGIAALNPTLIASWTAAVTVLHATSLVGFTASNAGAFAVGTTLGIVTWSAVLVYLIWRLRGQLEPAGLDRLRRAAGYFVLGLSFVFLCRFATSFG